MSNQHLIDSYPTVTSYTAVGGNVPIDNLAKAIKTDAPGILKNQLQNVLLNIDNKKDLLALLTTYKEQKAFLDQLTLTVMSLKSGLTPHENEKPDEIQQKALDKIVQELAQANKTLTIIKKKIRQFWLQNSDVDYSSKKQMKKYWQQISVIFDEDIEETVTHLRKFNLNIDFGAFRNEFRHFLENPELEAQLLTATTDEPKSVGNKIASWFKNKKLSLEAIEDKKINFIATLIIRLKGGNVSDRKAVTDMEALLVELRGK